MKSFMKTLVLIVLILVALLALPLILPSGGKQPNPEATEGLPWQIEPLPDGGSRVFGLMPGGSTLDEARKRLGNEPQIALVVAPGESGALEAYFDSVTAGFVTGKMVMTLESTQEQREQIAARARKVEYMESTTRRITLSDEDLARAWTTRIVAIVFIPSVNIDEQIILQRFGAPDERIRGGEHREHFLYRAKGLDVQLDAQGKEVLQYVAPRDFALLRDPLVKQ